MDGLESNKYEAILKFVESMKCDQFESWLRSVINGESYRVLEYEYDANDLILFFQDITSDDFVREVGLAISNVLGSVVGSRLFYKPEQFRLAISVLMKIVRFFYSYCVDNDFDNEIHIKIKKIISELCEIDGSIFNVKALNLSALLV